MLEQATATHLYKVAELANMGQRAEAAMLCREIVRTQPDYVPALLWLGYTSPNQVESEDAIAKAYDLQPQDPTVLKAVDWYNTHFVDPSSPAPAPAAEPPREEPQNKGDHNQLQTPVGEPVRDSASFFTSQTGNMIIGSTIVMVVNIAIFVNYTFLRGISWTPFGAPRIYFAILAAGMALIAAGFLVYSVRDVLTPPVKAHGFITNRKELRRNIKTASGMTAEFYYELDFIPDETVANGPSQVHLHLTKEQYEASARSNRAFVIYSKRLGTVRLYQPLRSKY